jgi:hypothetical protein
MKISQKYVAAALIAVLSTAIALAAPPIGKGANGGGGGTKSKFTTTTTCLTEQAAPTISGSPSTSVLAGSSYDFQPSAADANCDPLTFSIAGKPVWATFDSATGRLSGTPSSSHVGIAYNVTISVSDGTSSDTLAPFNLEVLSANTAPTITGTPSTTGQVGFAYSFRPGAKDADGDPLSFSVSNPPRWASFDAATGQLSGTPSDGDVGSYSNIVISVSDGQLTASLAPFSIEVQQVSNGSATLSWQPPTARTDGTALTDLAGYRIHYGSSPSSYTQRITITNPGITTYVVENLPAGTWYFAATAYDTAGLESDYSNAGSKTIL